MTGFLLLQDMTAFIHRFEACHAGRFIKQYYSIHSPVIIALFPLFVRLAVGMANERKLNLFTEYFTVFSNSN
jgi:hypothetical protein